jgi:hypothetical protein
MEQLEEAYHQGKLILFAGAGISMNLGLPSWSELIEEISKELGYDPEIFKTYGDNLALAEYYKIRRGNLGSLRSWMDREWHKDRIDISKSLIHELIVKGKFASIYTTNYDRWLERSHDVFGVKFHKIANVGDISTAPDGARQIIKLHGDFDDDSSIVLDETSYFERLNFEAPLDIKLRSDVLGKSVLFIGYSLSDLNMRLLFYKLMKIWERSKNTSLYRPKSHIFMHRPNPVQEAIFESWGIKMIDSEVDEANGALEQFLQKLVQS